MGSKHSKGEVRMELQPLVPRAWTEVEQLYLRFQQEGHRRKGDIQAQYFISAAMFQAMLAPMALPKAQVLSMFHVLDRNKHNKITAMDFFSGLALVVEGKKSTKFECSLVLCFAGLQ